ncbi:hypothetical protein HWV23_02710 [Natronomonas halophila]|uniref:hypothetical protein n=1 Tax=Natronomonas halophila TaxID=2747817 RepID=UPI0015B6351A|nr:hypothetical protein [Natronomonas halophila]QLD84611.1 hypothetical protein HWV23_02425 [Natronomonas halophila]QLD84667.1 hypothetical protein HWV23_02710 [Natronomonas halophila]
MPSDTRGRLTVPDIAFLTFSIAIVAALYPVFWERLQANVGVMSTGTAYLFQLILPLAVLVLLGVIFVKATAGGG